MTNKATKSKVTPSGPIQRAGRRVSPPPTSPMCSDQISEISEVLSVTGGASEGQVLDSLLSRITDKLGDQGVEKAQMREFLSLILDTDPALKEEILRGIRVSK
jgi:hypothetical protein